MRCLNQLKQVVQSCHTIYRQDWQSGSSTPRYMYTHQIHVLLCSLFILAVLYLVYCVCVLYVNFSHLMISSLDSCLPTCTCSRLSMLGVLGLKGIVASYPGSLLGVLGLKGILASYPGSLLGVLGLKGIVASYPGSFLGVLGLKGIVASYPGSLGSCFSLHVP